ncbi:MAG: MipA/OmpV family protein [Pseudomonadota bacterium]
MSTKTRTRVLSAVACLALFSPLAFAQEPESPQPSGQQRQGPPTGLSYELGVGTIANPAFQGASSYDTTVVPYFDVRYSDAQGLKYFGNVPQGFGGYIKRDRDGRGSQNDWFVSLAPGFANRDSDELVGIDEFGPSAELRLGWEFARGSWALGATVAQAVATGHEGAYLDLNASWRKRLGQRGFFSFGPRIRIADRQYMNAFYGITPRESVTSGLGVFEAGAGVESVGVQGILSVPLGERWRLTTVAALTRLQQDAADSTLTREPNQGFFLTALTRRF